MGWHLTTPPTPALPPIARALDLRATENVSAQDLKSLRALGEEQKLERYLCVSLETRRRTIDGITVLPYQAFLEALWAGEYDP